MPSDGDSVAGYRAGQTAAGSGSTGRSGLGGRGLRPAQDTIAVEERFGYHWLPLSGYLLSVKTIGNALLRASPFRSCRSGCCPEIAAGRLLFLPGLLGAVGGNRPYAALRTRRTSRATATGSSPPATRSGPGRTRRRLDLPRRAHEPGRGEAATAASPSWSRRSRPTRDPPCAPFPTMGGGVLCETFLERGGGTGREPGRRARTAAGACSWAPSTTSGSRARRSASSFRLSTTWSPRSWRRGHRHGLEAHSALAARRGGGGAAARPARHAAARRR